MAQVPNAIWLPGVLTGGLAGSALTVIVNWIRAKFDARTARASHVRALKQELRHTQWLIDYNYKRISDTTLLDKGLACIGTSNVERVLFDGTMWLSLTPAAVGHLLGYYEQVVYHNCLVAEYTALLPTPAPVGGTATDRAKTCANEIAAICKPDESYKPEDPQQCLRTRVERLLEELERGRDCLLKAHSA